MKSWKTILPSAIFIGLSFPTVLFGVKLPALGFLAWFGLVPLLFLVSQTSPKKAFQYGWFTAFLFYLLTFYWIVIALKTFGNMALLWSILITLLLAMMEALYIGATFYCAQLLVRRGAERMIVLPALWTLAEWVRHYTPFQGFPWGHLALSQTSFLPLIQMADIVGVFGIIFLIVWVNVWFFEMILKFRKQGMTHFVPKTIMTVLFVGATLIYGFFQLHYFEATKVSKSLRVGLIQPNISQQEKGDASKQKEHQTLFQNAVRQMQDAADLIVWPETAWEELVLDSEAYLPPHLLGLEPHRAKQPWNLIGLNTVSIKNNSNAFYNSAFLIHPNGSIVSKYHKTHLVPFGEYIPLKKIFSVLEPVAAVGDFKAGKNQQPLEMNGFQLAPLICFEDIFPNLSRVMAKKGAHLLINMTNDAWYGISSAPYQHLALSQFRAIETRRTLVRATNTGITAVIDATGAVRAAAPIFEQSLLIHLIPLLEKETLYTELGDWFIGACFLLLLWQGIQIYVKRVKRTV